MPRGKTQFQKCVGQQMRGRSGSRSEIRTAFKQAVKDCKGGRGSRNPDSRRTSLNGRRTGCQTRFQACVSSKLRKAGLKGASQQTIRSEFSHAARECRSSKGYARKGGNPGPRKAARKGIFGILG